MGKKENKPVAPQIDSTFKPLNLLWTVAVIGVAVIPILINVFMLWGNFRTAQGLSNSDWLNFWGGYLSGALGLLFTMLMFMITYVQNEKQHKQTRDEMKEQQRVSLLPVFSVDFDFKSPDENCIIDYIDFEHHSVGYNTAIKNSLKLRAAAFIPNLNPYLNQFTIKNIGLAAALDVLLVYKDHNGNYKQHLIGNIGKDSNWSIYFFFPDTPEDQKYALSIKYKDISEQVNYYQEFIYEIDGGTFPTTWRNGKLSSPKIITPSDKTPQQSPRPLEEDPAPTESVAP